MASRPPGPGAAGRTPKKPTGTDHEQRQPFAYHQESLCQTMPAVGTLPVGSDSARRRQVVRLVSAAVGMDLSIELQSGINRVGRQRANNHIVLVSPEISRFHAEIDVAARSIVLRDLGSANGTFVNGQAVSGSVALAAGDLIQFSDKFSLRLLIDLPLAEAERITMVGDSDTAGSDAEPQSKDPTDHYWTQQRPNNSVGELPKSLRQRTAAYENDPLPSGPLRPVQSVPVRPDSAIEITGQHQAVSQDDFSDDEITNHYGKAKSAALVTNEQLPVTAREEDLAPIDEERQTLAALYQLGRRCQNASTLDEVDNLLINVVERVLVFDRGFLTYQMQNGDWRFVISPRGADWDRRLLRDLIRAVLNVSGTLVVRDSLRDTRLGTLVGSSDSRLLSPLRFAGATVGGLFLQSLAPLSAKMLDFVSLFSDIAGQALARAIGNPTD